jgi:hypothetical protein
MLIGVSQPKKLAKLFRMLVLRRLSDRLQEVLNALNLSILKVIRKFNRLKFIQEVAYIKEHIFDSPQIPMEELKLSILKLINQQRIQKET